MTTIYLTKTQIEELPKRHTNDNYQTPLKLIGAAMWRYGLLTSGNIDSILDPGAGDGRWGKLAAQYTGAEIVAGVELDEMPKPVEFTHWYSPQDYLTWAPDRKYDMICGNPPYRLAEAFIRKSWDILEPTGRLVLLLPLQFQAGIARYNKLWQEIPIYEVSVCSRRPSFYGGGTNGTDYGIYVWYRNRGVPHRYTTRLLYYDRDER